MDREMSLIGENPLPSNDEHGMLTNEYLQWMLEKTVKSSNFRGVFACDLLPTNLLNNNSVIVNTDPHVLPGLHYVCLLRRKNIYWYFDPMNLELETSFPRLAMELSKRKISITHVLTSPIQNEKSRFCGFFCMQWLLSTMYPSIKQIQYKKKKLEKNDEICKRNIVKIIERTRK